MKDERHPMTTMYKYNIGHPEPIAVECETPCWPNLDADGDKIYENSHFLSKAAAFEELIKNLNARVEMDKARIKEFEINLASINDRLATFAPILQEAQQKAQEK